VPARTFFRSARRHPLSTSFPFDLAIQGHPPTRRRLAERLAPRLARMATHYARRCGEDADDLLQEAWLGLLEGLNQLDPTIGQPDQYLLQRARFRLLDAIRRARVRRHSPLDDEHDPAAPAVEVPLADFTALLGETQRKVAAALLDGMTFREVGDALDCSSANVAYHVQKLREVYGRWAG